MGKTSWMLAVLSSLLVSASGIAPARAESITLPVGTKFHVVLETSLTTKGNKVGDPFRGRLVIPVFANEREALPVGTVVEGKLASLQAPGRVRGSAEMQLRPEKFILPDGRDFLLAATLTEAQTGDDLEVDSEEGTVSRTGKEGMDVKGTAGGAVMGAGIGGMVGGGKGALIGAGAIATVAVLRQIFKRGNDANLPAGSEIVLELNRDISIPLMEEVPPSDRPALRRGDTEKPVAPVVVCQTCSAGK
ncbi:MAG: hypothetical protein ACRD88_03980 [Terriglobia bacterium]